MGKALSPAWRPTLRWEPIPAGDCIALDLSPMWPWEGLYFKWGAFGALFCARVRRDAGTSMEM